MARYKRELTNLANIKTFRKIDMPKHLIKADLLPLIQVFKYKTDSDNYITKYKSRLIIKKDLQYIKEKIYAAIIAI